MFSYLAASAPGNGEPPDASRRREPWRRLGFLLALGSALALTIVMMAPPQPAQAMSAIDGQWTVSHGGTGQLTLNADRTYTSTCQVYPNYEDAWCPDTSGTFLYSSGYVDFHGADGSIASYRVGGLVTSPDIIMSYFGSRTNSPLVMTKGTEFTCTDWYLPARVSPANPLLKYDAATGHFYLTGSHEQATSQTVAETAPQYFQNGSCDSHAPAVHIDSLADATVSSPPGTWAPQVMVTMKDRVGVPASGVTVNATFQNPTGDPDNPYYYQKLQCVTVADGTCIFGGFTITTSTMKTIEFKVWSASKAGSLWIEGKQFMLLTNALAVSAPTPTPTPTPIPATHHVGDLDNASTATSSTTWLPRVTVTILDANGAPVVGANVMGTFSRHTGWVTCTSQADGTCTLGYFSFSRSVKSTVVTVTKVVAVSSTYAPKTNSDPDGDSNGTTITLTRP